MFAQDFASPNSIYYGLRQIEPGGDNAAAAAAAAAAGVDGVVAARRAEFRSRAEKTFGLAGAR